uniref:Uncharacterized protein n=1 Tax=Haemonchus contortus TaxID=6289 RepID=W6NS65_HAECO
MLFIFAVLSSVVAFVAAQGKSSPLPDDAKEALQYINGANHEDIVGSFCSTKWLARFFYVVLHTAVGRVFGAERAKVA